MNSLINKAKEDRDRFNYKITNGLAKDHLANLVPFLDSVIRASIKSVDSRINLSYLGYRLLTPQEEFEMQFQSSATYNVVDVSKSTLYTVVFIFEYEGEVIERPISLPYCEDGGVITLSDTMYAVVPVLSEYIISSTNKGVFVRLMKDKINMVKIERNILVNGVKQPFPVITSKLYKFSRNAEDKLPVGLMLFVKYGFDGVFKKYFDTKVEVLDLETYDGKFDKTHNIYSSVSIKPRSLKDNNYIPHNIALAVSKEINSPFMNVLITTLITTFDLINVYSKNIHKVLNTDKEDTFWKVLLGKMIFKNQYTIDKILTTMHEYLEVLKGYIDDITQHKLQESNIFIKDFYDLIALVIKDYNDLVMNSDELSASIEKRYVDINYYIAYKHIEGINRTFYSINQDFNKGKLNKDKLIKILNKHFRKKMIFSITNTGLNIALNPMDSSVDNFFTKITSTLEDQNRGSGVVRSKKSTFPKSTRVIHGEDLYLGTLLYLSKKSPTPRLKINPYADITPTGRFNPTKEEKRTIDKLDSMFKGRANNNMVLDIIQGLEIDTDVDNIDT